MQVKKIFLASSAEFRRFADKDERLAWEWIGGRPLEGK